MPQLLELIKRGDRFTPTVYRFGAREHLNIHRADQYADLTDAETGSCVRRLSWQELRDWGYSPAKLLDGNTTDQFMTADDSVYSHLQSGAKQVLVGLVIAGLIMAVGAITGCNNYIISQLNKDTSSHKLLLADSVNQDDLDDDAIYLASKQYADAKHANDFLAKANGRR